MPARTEWYIRPGSRNLVRIDLMVTPRQIQNYISRISGPLLDRIDIHVEVPNVQYKDLTSDSTCEPSEDIRDKVTKARNIQLKRFPNVYEGDEKALSIR